MAFDLKSLAPYFGASGNALVNLDENTTGADDFAGELLIYSADVIASVEGGGDLPDFPSAIQHGVAEKITGAARVPLIVASSVLPIVEFQVSGKAKTALKYVNQTTRQLLAGQIVSPVPDALKKELQKAQA